MGVCPLSMDPFLSRWYKHTSEGRMFMKAGMKGVPQANVLGKDLHKVTRKGLTPSGISETSASPIPLAFGGK